MRTAIVIPTHKRATMMARLLDDLTRCARPPECRIYVVENGPRGNTEELCERSALRAQLHYLYLPRGHKSVALNTVIESTSEDFIIFFDDDVALPAGIIATYVDAAERYGPGHFFGGPLIADIDIPCPPDLAPYLPLSALGWAHADHEAILDQGDFDYFFGANWAAFRSDLTRAGLFSEDLGITASSRSAMGEENDIQERLIRAGARPVYLPDATVRHHVPPECYTAKWVWRRRFRLGVTEWKRTAHAEYAHCRRIFGVPAWLLRAVLQQKIKAMLSSLFDWGGKTDIQMKDAHLRGLLYGAWTARKHDRTRPTAAT
jgi:GT2 family glycosyltransferase